MNKWQIGPHGGIASRIVSDGSRRNIGGLFIDVGNKATVLDPSLLRISQAVPIPNESGVCITELTTSSDDESSGPGETDPITGLPIADTDDQGAGFANKTSLIQIMVATNAFYTDDGTHPGPPRGIDAGYVKTYIGRARAADGGNGPSSIYLDLVVFLPNYASTGGDDPTGGIGYERATLQIPLGTYAAFFLSPPIYTSRYSTSFGPAFEVWYQVVNPVAGTQDQRCMSETAYYFPPLPEDNYPGPLSWDGLFGLASSFNSHLPADPTDPYYRKYNGRGFVDPGWTEFPDGIHYQRPESGAPFSMTTWPFTCVASEVGTLDSNARQSGLVVLGMEIISAPSAVSADDTFTVDCKVVNRMTGADYTAFPYDMTASSPPAPPLYLSMMIPNIGPSKNILGASISTGTLTSPGVFRFTCNVKLAGTWYWDFTSNYEDPTSLSNHFTVHRNRTYHQLTVAHGAPAQLGWDAGAGPSLFGSGGGEFCTNTKLPGWSRGFYIDKPVYGVKAFLQKSVTFPQRHNPRVGIYDRNQNICDDAVNEVTLSFSVAPGFTVGLPGAVTGTLVKAAVTGYAEFDDITLFGLGFRFYLTAIATGLLPAFFDTVPTSHANRLGIGLDCVVYVIECPSKVKAGEVFKVKARICDRDGNPVLPTSADPLVIFNSNPPFGSDGNGNLNGDPFGEQFVDPVAGVAEFNVFLPNPGTYTLSVSSSFDNYGTLRQDPRTPAIIVIA